MKVEAVAQHSNNHWFRLKLFLKVKSLEMESETLEADLDRKELRRRKEVEKVVIAEPTLVTLSYFGAALSQRVRL